MESYRLGRWVLGRLVSGWVGRWVSGRWSVGRWSVNLINSIQYTIHWAKTQILNKFPSDKVSGTKSVLCFLSRAPTHHSFTFNLRFLYMNWSTRFYLSKTVCRIFRFQLRFAFIIGYIFVQQNAWTLWLYNL